MGTPLGPKYIPYTYMDPLGVKAGPVKMAKGMFTYVDVYVCILRDLCECMCIYIYICMCRNGR